MWPNDLALSVTHFPTRKQTFAALFGCSREQEKTVISCLKQAGEDVTHPMVLVEILAELERQRQFKVVDNMINELEMQIFELDRETVTAWNQHGTAQAERNRRKTKAWMNMSFARNALPAQKALLTRMHKHVDEPETAYRDAEIARSDLGTKLLDLDGDRIRVAGLMMKDRLLGLVDEYEEKIRDCSMRVDGMAMAEQLVCGSKVLSGESVSGTKY